MPELALALFGTYVLLAFGWRSWLQARRTGHTGFVGISGRPGSAEWTGGVAFVLALLLGLSAPVLQLVGVLEPVEMLDGTAGHLAGVALAVFGTISAYLATSFIGRRKQTDEKAPDAAATHQDVLAEVKRLAAELEQNYAGLETRLTADQDRFAGVLEARLARIEALLSGPGRES